MKIERKRYVVMRKNRNEIWCGLSKNFHFVPVSELKDTAIKTYRTENQALSDCSSWDKDFEVVPVLETIETDFCTIQDAKDEQIENLKRLLKLAIEDLHYYTNESTIHFLCDICCKNPVDCAEKDECYFEWEHADEVKELLDDVDSVSD